MTLCIRLSSRINNVFKRRDKTSSMSAHFGDETNSRASPSSASETALDSPVEDRGSGLWFSHAPGDGIMGWQGRVGGSAKEERFWYPGSSLPERRGRSWSPAVRPASVG